MQTEKTEWELMNMRSIVAHKRVRNEDWLAPKPIPSDLACVEAFALDLLPDRLAPWIDDIATRLQCPPDYPAITAMTALGAILGRKIAIKPQMKTDWIEFAGDASTHSHFFWTLSR